MGSMALHNLNVQSDGNRIDRHIASTTGIAGSASGAASYKDMLSSFMNDNGDRQSNNKGRSNNSGAESSAKANTNVNNNAMSMLNNLSLRTLASPVMNYNLGAQAEKNTNESENSSEKYDHYVSMDVEHDETGNIKIVEKWHYGPGWRACRGEISTKNQVEDVIISKDKTLSASASDMAKYSGNLDAEQTINMPITSTVTVYGGDGQKYNVPVYFTRTDNGEWVVSLDTDITKSQATLYAEDGTPTFFNMQPTRVTFDENGKANKIMNGGPFISYRDNIGAHGLSLDLSEVTQKADYTTMYSTSNGYPEGKLLELNVNENGEIIGKYSNGTLQLEGKIELGKNKKEVLMGDVNEDGRVDEVDQNLLDLYFLKEEKNIRWQNADFNGDGKITLLDISRMDFLVKEEKNKASNVVYTENNVVEKLDEKSNIVNKDYATDYDNYSYISPIKYRSGGSIYVDVSIYGNNLLWIRDISNYNLDLDAVEINRMANGDVKLIYRGGEYIFDKSVNTITYQQGEPQLMYINDFIEMINARKKQIDNPEETQIDNPEEKESNGLENFDKYMEARELFEDPDSGKFIINRGESNTVSLHGYSVDGNYHVSEVNMDNIKSEIYLDGDSTKVKSLNNEFAEVDGEAVIKFSSGVMSILSNKSVNIETKEKNIVLELSGPKNKIKIEGESNTAILRDGRNEVDICEKNAKIEAMHGNNKIIVNASDALIACGNGKETINVNAPRTIIYGFDSSRDELAIGSFQYELEVKQVGKHLMIKKVNGDVNNFVVSLLGYSDIDKIQQIVTEHNEKLKMIEIDNRLSSLENEVSRTFTSIVEEEIKSFVSPDLNLNVNNTSNLPDEVVQAYTHMITDAISKSKTEDGNEFTDVETLAKMVKNGFADMRPLTVDDYKIAPVLTFSFGGIGAFAAEITKKGSNIKSFLTVQSNGDAVKEAVKKYLEKAKELEKNALYNAIREYVKELSEALEVGKDVKKLANKFARGVLKKMLGEEGNVDEEKMVSPLFELGETKIENTIRDTLKNGNEILNAIKGLREAKKQWHKVQNNLSENELKKLTATFDTISNLLQIV
ncbi:dockerin type I domain-containing protein [Selenomonas ruminantium]|uniref:dockerin type I domain-containing protein n=1 Tax=Selenomonas ruminantium TaxID=971 RepID=UPI0026EF29A8|nr:dockerin type I domain-containing protein [Selenomonas ruminantium]